MSVSRRRGLCRRLERVRYRGRPSAAAYDRSVPEFLSGLDLARGFYEEAIAPLVGDVPHSAALLGWGSEVLGFDSERSTDHGWGPRLQVFVGLEDAHAVGEAIDSGLPESYRGWPTRFGWDAVPVSHHVQVTPLGEWLEEQLGFDPRRGMSARDWLVTPQQLLLEVTAGAVFHDGLGELRPLRESLRWYPDDVWVWMLGCQWRRLAQEEPFVGRTAEVGDELGSRLVAARLVREIVRLCFLLERRYAPYSKWLGSAFRSLDAYRSIGSSVSDALAAADFTTRQDALTRAIEELARRHNALGITEQLDVNVRSFHGRPFLVLDSDRFVDACLERVEDPWLRSRPPIGAVDQFVDSTDVLSYPSRARRARTMYESD